MKTFRKSYRLRKKKSVFRFLKNRFFWLFFLILIIVGIVFYFVIFAGNFQIKKIRILGNQNIATDNIKNLVEGKIIQRILFLNSKSIFLINSDEIKNDILKEFPQIANLNLKRKLPDILSLEVKERKMETIWCEIKENCFSMDGTGVIFEGTLRQQDILTIRDLKEIEPTPILGEKAIGGNLYQLIKNIDTKLKETEVQPKEFIILAEDRLNVQTNQGWEIYFDIKGDIGWQLTELKLVLEKEIPPSRRGNLEYIDLRFSKVYYKYR